MKKTPVAVIGFVREKVLGRTLTGLAAADEVLDRDIYVYLSSPRNDEELIKTNKVLEVVKEFQQTLLPNIKIIQRTENNGCSLNIRYAIDNTIAKQGRVIVVEEDVLVSRTFLRFMDAALDFYEKDKRVWCINGYNNLFLKIPKKYRHGVFLNPRNMAWGWGTWVDRWQATDFSTDRWPEFKANNDNLRKLADAGSDVPAMVDSVHSSNGDAWDAQASFYLVENGLYCVEPIHSLTKTIGINSEDAVHSCLPHGYYEKQKLYNFMPKLVSVDEMLAQFPLLAKRFRYSVVDHRPMHFAWRCVMRVLKHFIGPLNNTPIEVM